MSEILYRRHEIWNILSTMSNESTLRKKYDSYQSFFCFSSLVLSTNQAYRKNRGTKKYIYINTLPIIEKRTSFNKNIHK